MSWTAHTFVSSARLNVELSLKWTDKVAKWEAAGSESNPDGLSVIDFE